MAKVGVHRRTRHLDVILDPMFGRNMGKLGKAQVENLRIFLLKVLELRSSCDDGDVLSVLHHVTSGGAVRADEAASKAQEILHYHSFGIGKSGAGPGREARQPHFP